MRIFLTGTMRAFYMLGFAAMASRILPVVFAALLAAPAGAQTLLRISTPAVPDDWHVKMLYVLRDDLAKSAPGRFEVQVHHSGTLFRQGAEVVAMQRGNLEMALLSMQDIARQLPEYSIFTAGYLIATRAPAQGLGRADRRRGTPQDRAGDGHRAAAGRLPRTRELGLREPRPVKTPADLAGLKLRMPGSKEWLFLGQALGASATPLAFTEVYLGLKTAR